MKLSAQSVLVNLKFNILLKQSPEVIEQLFYHTPETKDAYENEVLIPMFQGEIPGKEFSQLNSKHIFYVPLSTGEFVFYEVTPPGLTSTQSDFYTNYSVHYIVPKHEVDNWERKTLLTSIRKNVDGFTAPFRQFVLGNKISFFAVGVITAVVEFFLS